MADEEKEPVSEAEIVEHIVGSWDDWKHARRDKESLWRDEVNAYLTTIDESKYKDWPWRSKVADTFIQETGDSISSALRNSLFPTNEEYFDIVGVDEQGKTHQQEMQEYMQQQLYKTRFVEKFKPFIKQLSVIGNAPAILPWRIKKKTSTKRVKVRGEDGRTRVEKQTFPRTIYDNFDFEALDAFDVVFDPSQIYFDKTPFIRRMVRSINELKRDADLYKNLDRLEESGDTLDGEDIGKKRERLSVFGLNFQEDKEGIEILEAYGDFEIEGVLYEDYLISIGNRKTVIRFEPNPYWGGRPIVWGTYDNLWFTSYGKSAIEPVMGTYHLINTFTNQKSDILNLIINGCYSFVEDGVIDPENLMLRPGGFIEVGHNDNIRPLHPSTNVTLAFGEIETLRNRGEKSTGASTYDKGGIPRGKRTAFEANIIKQGSSTRFNDITKHIGDSVIEYTLNFFLESTKQFKFGSGEISDEALLGDYRINYYGAEQSAVKAYNTQQFMQLLGIVGQVPQLMAGINVNEVLVEARKLLSITNKKLVNTPEQTQKNLDALKQQEQGGKTPPDANGGLQNPDSAMMGLLGGA